MDFQNSSKDTSKYLQHGAEVLGLGRSKVFILSLRPPFLWDIRKLFDVSSDDDNVLYNFYLKDIDVLKLGKLEAIRQIALKVNEHMTYEPNIITFKQVEYWASPIQVHQLGRGDCNCYAILICYLARLAGISPFEVFVRAGDVNVDGQVEGHAHVILFDWNTYKWYPVEGSLYPSICLSQLGKTPIGDNSTYANMPTYFITNDVLSFSSYPIKLVR